MPSNPTMSSMKHSVFFPPPSVALASKCCCMAPRRIPTSRVITKTATKERSTTKVERIVDDSDTLSQEERYVNTNPTMDVVTLDRVFTGDVDFRLWEKFGVVVRLCYGIAMYAAMGWAGMLITSVAGVDSMGGFDANFDALLHGLGYAVVPIMFLLFIYDDDVVKISPHARAIREVEDEELRNYFSGMSPCQFFMLVTASSIGEELFYRAAVQGTLTNIFVGTSLGHDADGIAAMTGILPPFVPFAQALAATMTAALTGALYYAASLPDPTVIIAPRESKGRDLRELFAAWYDRRRMRRIYSPLLEGLLSLYLGFEWIHTSNILAPMITHGVYSGVVLGHGLWKINDHRKRLRQRVKTLKIKKSRRL